MLSRSFCYQYLACNIFPEAYTCIAFLLLPYITLTGTTINVEERMNPVTMIVINFLNFLSSLLNTNISFFSSMYFVVCTCLQFELVQFCCLVNGSKQTNKQTNKTKQNKTRQKTKQNTVHYLRKKNDIERITDYFCIPPLEGCGLGP